MRCRRGGSVWDRHLVSAIGIALALAQPGLGQKDAEQVETLVVAGERDRALVDRFRRSIGRGKAREWAAGWQLAVEMGTAAQPVLRRVWREEGNPSARFAILAAIVLSGGDRGAEFAAQRVAKSDTARERFMAALCLAVSTDRSFDRKPLVDLMNSSSAKPLERIVAAMAASRVGVEAPDSWFRESEPGFAAAARFGSARVDDPGLEPWVRRKAPKHAHLVGRAAFLGVDSRERMHTALEDRVRALLASPNRTSLGVTASICAARVLEPEILRAGTDDTFPAAWSVPVLATDPEHRAALYLQLRAVLSSPRASSRVRCRTAVELALGAPTGELAAVVEAVPDDARDVERAFCLGFALRLLKRPHDVELTRTLELPRDSAAAWIRLLRGDAVSDEIVFDDPMLNRAFQAARRGVLLPSGASRAIEDALWRTGHHPMRVVREAELEFLRDVLVAGSDIGRDVLQPVEKPYLARGLASSDLVFEVAMSLFGYLNASEPRPPAALRLR